MANITFGLDHVCSGGEHAVVTVTKDGGAARTFVFNATNMLDPLTEDQLQDAALVILRFRMQGKTRVQIRNDLQAGFTVTI